jgi:hypothetical protein
MAKKKELIVQSNNSTRLESKDVPPRISKWLEDYYDCKAMHLKPATEGFFERLATELLDWAENNEEALKVSQFYLPKGIGRETFDSWVSKYPTLKEAYKTALIFIGNRREIGALKGKLHSQIMLKSAHLYDEDWAKIYQDERKQNQLGSSAGEVKILVMKSFDQPVAIEGE